MTIYTKSGDTGETSLFNGTRVKKFNSRIEMLGLLDEVNSYIGALNTFLNKESLEAKFMHKLQSLFFEIGSEVANPQLEKTDFKDFGLYTNEVEKNIDQITEELPALQSFILPGGHTSASYAHMCRTKIRNCERKFFELTSEAEFNPTIGKFLNRLSDYFFTLARKLNKDNNVDDVIWEQGQYC